MIAFIPIFFALLAPQAFAAIVTDLSCTEYNGTEFVYTPAAVACENTISDTACQVLYPNAQGYPSAGNNSVRSVGCSSTDVSTAKTTNEDMRSAAITTCPKTCGFCCLTTAYSCSNVAYPRLNCATITKAQCKSIYWRSIIAEDCPSACGFCDEGGCVDAIVGCAVDKSICTTIGMQDFVNTYCQRTCGRCSSSSSSSSTTTTSSSSSGSSSSCTSYNADSSTHCVAWAKNGFCTNTSYTAAQRKAYCATTCKIC